MSLGIIFVECDPSSFCSVEAPYMSRVRCKLTLSPAIDHEAWTLDLARNAEKPCALKLGHVHARSCVLQRVVCWHACCHWCHGCCQSHVDLTVDAEQHAARLLDLIWQLPRLLLNLKVAKSDLTVAKSDSCHDLAVAKSDLTVATIWQLLNLIWQLPRLLPAYSVISGAFCGSPRI
jgi:hypothetical protein